MATELQLPYFDVLPQLLAHYLSSLPARAVLVSVNEGTLLKVDDDSQIRIVNIAGLRPDEFETMLLSADLVLSDNRISSVLAKAVCAGVPAVALVNSMRLPQASAVDDVVVGGIVQDMEQRRPGSVFPFEVFPIWAEGDLRQLGLFEQPLYRAALGRAELFGGSATSRLLTNLLVDASTQQESARAQRAYLDGLAHLPTAADVLLTEPV